jgi:hypothetical protein
MASDYSTEKTSTATNGALVEVTVDTEDDAGDLDDVVEIVIIDAVPQRSPSALGFRDTHAKIVLDRLSSRER